MPNTKTFQLFCNVRTGSKSVTDLGFSKFLKQKGLRLQARVPIKASSPALHSILHIISISCTHTSGINNYSLTSDTFTLNIYHSQNVDLCSTFKLPERTKIGSGLSAIAIPDDTSRRQAYIQHSEAMAGLFRMPDPAIRKDHPPDVDYGAKMLYSTRQVLMP